MFQIKKLGKLVALCSAFSLLVLVLFIPFYFSSLSPSAQKLFVSSYQLSRCQLICFGSISLLPSFLHSHHQPRHFFAFLSIFFTNRDRLNREKICRFTDKGEQRFISMRFIISKIIKNMHVPKHVQKLLIFVWFQNEFSFQRDFKNDSYWSTYVAKDKTDPLQNPEDLEMNLDAAQVH